jgi:hypothetical protein
MSKKKKGKEREGKERKGIEEFGLAYSPICGEKWGGVIITKFGTRVNGACVMTCAIFCVDTSRFTDSVGGRKSGFPIYLVFRPYNFSTNVLM